MTDELKPCPFCGNNEIDIERDGQWYYAFCVKCGCGGKADLGISGATEVWNERPLESALAAENARLRADLAALVADDKRLAEILLEVDWSVLTDEHEIRYCPICGEAVTHKNDCGIITALVAHRKLNEDAQP